MLLINQHSVCETMPPLTSRFVLQLRLEVIQTFCGQPDESTPDGLWLEGVSAIVASTLPLCALSQFNDNLRVSRGGHLLHAHLALAGLVVSAWSRCQSPVGQGMSIGTKGNCKTWRCSTLPLARSLALESTKCISAASLCSMDCLQFRKIDTLIHISSYVVIAQRAMRL